MNERIAKLANQSGFDVDATGKFGNYSEIHRLEKFAELIVRECAEIAFHNVVNLSSIADAEWVEENIKDHFGVE